MSATLSRAGDLRDLGEEDALPLPGGEFWRMEWPAPGPRRLGAAPAGRAPGVGSRIPGGPRTRRDHPTLTHGKPGRTIHRMRHGADNVLGLPYPALTYGSDARGSVPEGFPRFTALPEARASTRSRSSWATSRPGRPNWTAVCRWPRRVRRMTPRCRRSAQAPGPAKPSRPSSVKRSPRLGPRGGLIGGHPGRPWEARDPSRTVPPASIGSAGPLTAIVPSLARGLQPPGRAEEFAGRGGEPPIPSHQG